MYYHPRLFQANREGLALLAAGKREEGSARIGPGLFKSVHK